MAPGQAIRQQNDGRRAVPADPFIGVRVHALGPLRVDLDGVEVRQLGGAKAGSWQATAVFAFLLDRAELGVRKDEVLDLIWPDVDCERADLAFHRTVLGLRGTLAGAACQTPVRYEQGRYRLDPKLVTWDDVTAFDRLVGRSSADGNQRLLDLTAAVELYRGDYLDDCPYYGDSASVERNRSLLRSTYVDTLAELAELRAGRGDVTGARRCLRLAAATADDGVAVAPAPDLEHQALRLALVGARPRLAVPLRAIG